MCSVGVLISEPGNTNESCSFNIELHLRNELQLPRCLKRQWLDPHYVVVNLQQPSLPSWFLANHRTSAQPEGWSQSPYPSKVPSVKVAVLVFSYLLLLKCAAYIWSSFVNFLCYKWCCCCYHEWTPWIFITIVFLIVHILSCMAR